MPENSLKFVPLKRKRLRLMSAPASDPSASNGGSYTLPHLQTVIVGKEQRPTAKIIICKDYSKGNCQRIDCPYAHTVIALGIEHGPQGYAGSTYDAHFISFSGWIIPLASSSHPSLHSLKVSSSVCSLPQGLGSGVQRLPSRSLHQALHMQILPSAAAPLRVRTCTSPRSPCFLAVSFCPQALPSAESAHAPHLPAGEVNLWVP